MRSAVLALLSVAVPAQVFAGLSIYIVPAPGVETPAPALVDLGTAPPREVLSVNMRLRNTGEAAERLTKLYAFGTGFKVTGAPSLPYIVAAGTNVDFSIEFTAENSGGYSANLIVNDQSLTVRAVVSDSYIVTLDGNPLISSGTIEFGKLERGATVAKLVLIENRSSSPVQLGTASVTGSGFALAAPPLPMLFQPGQKQALEITCNPATSGFLTGSLQIDNRTYKLAALVSEPKPPRPGLQISPAAPGSAEQVQVKVPLADVSRANLTGTLKVELRPAVKDDGVIFTASGKPSISFQVRDGDQTARFGDKDYVTLQTGTTAATLVVTAELGGYTEQATMEITPSRVVVDSGRATRGPSSLAVEVRGYDNTRSASDLSFIFFDASGRELPAPVRVDAGAQFRGFFDSSTLGGMFSLKATFPVTGDPAKVSGVEVELRNGAGTARSERLRF